MRNAEGTSSSISPGASTAGGLGGGGLGGGARRTRIPSPLTCPSTVVGSCDAVSGLTRISPAFAADSIVERPRHVGPDHQELALSAPVVITRKTPLCTPCDMRNRDGAAFGDDRPAGAERRPHRDGRADRARRVVGSVEEEAQRVAAELEEVAAGRERDVEERGEGVVEDRGELFGPDPAPAGEALRELGEPRHVGEAQGARTPSTTLRGCCGTPGC